MDDSKCLFKKYECDGLNHADGRIPEVICYRPFKLDQDLALFLPHFEESLRVINDQDLSGEVTHEVMGEALTLPKSEAQLYMYLRVYHCEIQLALRLSGDLVGFILYNKVFLNGVAIRFQYVVTSHRKTRVAHGLVDQLSPKPTYVLFQTRNGKPPLRLLEFTRPFRQLLSEDEKLSTWWMPWPQ